MTYQMVLQWNVSSLADYDRLIRIEDLLIRSLGAGHEVDGHDEGSGQMNIFIRTDDPKQAFDQTRIILSQTEAWRTVRIAYREDSKSAYTILWPNDLAEFCVV